jgi:hypothetical protein
LVSRDALRKRLDAWKKIKKGIRRSTRAESDHREKIRQEESQKEIDDSGNEPRESL